MNVLRPYLRLFAGHRRHLAAFLAMAMLQLLLAAPVPFVVKEVFDTAIPEGRMGLLVTLALLMLGLQAASGAVELLAANWMLGISTSVVEKLRQQVFDKLYALSIRFHETTPVTDVHDRVVHETERVDMMTRSGVAIATPAAVFALGILGVLVAINWLLFLVMVAYGPVMLTINRKTRHGLRQATRDLHSTFERLSARAFATLRAMRETRILGAEAEARREEDEVLRQAATAGHRHGLAQRVHLNVNRVVLAAWMVLILGVGGAGVIDGRLTLGELFAFYAGLALLRLPLEQLIATVPVVIAGRESLLRVFGLLETQDHRPYTGTRRLDVVGRVALVGVDFEYEPGVPVLRGVSLQVEPGEIVALVGPNGSGKTTIAGLLIGFYAPTAGEVTIDGVPYGELDMQHLRRQFGVLTQHPTLVPGTVGENIAYGRPATTHAELERALRLASASQVVAALEAGLDTRAYENGPLLSGGQMQRVALTRALLGRPRVLILDEPSTHLDVDALATLLENLRSLDDAPAMVLITHDAEVAAMAGTVYRVDGGRVAPAVGYPGPGG